jgi:hypothetical protein
MHAGMALLNHEVEIGESELESRYLAEKIQYIECRFSKCRCQVFLMHYARALAPLFRQHRYLQISQSLVTHRTKA